MVAVSGRVTSGTSPHLLGSGNHWSRTAYITFSNPWEVAGQWMKWSTDSLIEWYAREVANWHWLVGISLVLRVSGIQRELAIGPGMRISRLQLEKASIVMPRGTRSWWRSSIFAVLKAHAEILAISKSGIFSRCITRKEEDASLSAASLKAMTRFRGKWTRKTFWKSLLALLTPCLSISWVLESVDFKPHTQAVT